MKSCLNFSSLLLVTLTTPVYAFAVPTCHHYSIWKYPYKQTCGRGGTGIRIGLKIHEPRAMGVQIPPSAPITDDNDPNDHSWYVEITKLPPGLDDPRDAAIQKLKEYMNK